MSKLKSLYLILMGAAALLSASPGWGQQLLVDAPEPKLVSAAVATPLVLRSRPTHEFFDHRTIIAFSSAVALRSADSAYTCALGVGTTTHNADGSITIHREDSLPFNSCHGVVLMNAAFTGMGLGGSYVLHKMGWHKLERLPNWIVAAVPVYGIAYTATHQNEHTATTRR